MAKRNNKEKLTNKQIVAYMDFLNAKMTNKFQDLDQVMSTLGYYLKAYVEYNKQDKKFTKYLDKKQKEAEKKLGSDAPAKTEKTEISFKGSSKMFYKLFNKALNYSNKKDVKFFTMVDEDTMKQLSLIDTLFNSPEYEAMRNFSIDYREDIEGKLEKTSIAKKAS